MRCGDLAPIGSYKALVKAAALIAAEAAQRVQNWLIGQQIKKAQEAAARERWLQSPSEGRAKG